MQEPRRAEIASRPHLVARIISLRHEILKHGYWHRHWGQRVRILDTDPLRKGPQEDFYYVRRLPGVVYALETVNGKPGNSVLLAWNDEDVDVSGYGSGLYHLRDGPTHPVG